MSRRKGLLTRAKPFSVRMSGGGGGTIVQLSSLAGFKPGEKVFEYLTRDGDLIVSKRGPELDAQAPSGQDRKA